MGAIDVKKRANLEMRTELETKRKYLSDRKELRDEIMHLYQKRLIALREYLGINELGIEEIDKEDKETLDFNFFAKSSQFIKNKMSQVSNDKTCQEAIRLAIESMDKKALFTRREIAERALQYNPNITEADSMTGIQNARIKNPKLIKVVIPRSGQRPAKYQRI